jgi:broad specificity phosphatase PhoE
VREYGRKGSVSSLTKRLILIRHAHRDTEEASRDNGLSDKGRQQVKRLVKYLKTGLEGEKGFRCLSSPKKRCRETVEPIEESFRVEVEIDERLGETGPIEGRDEVISRLEAWIDEWKYQGPELLVACSHGDIIPILVERLTGARIGIKKCGLVEIESLGGECFLTGLVQKPGA